MSKKRIFEIAKEVGLSNKELLAKLKTMGIEVKSHMSSLDDFQIDKLKKELNLGGHSGIVEKRVTKTVIRRRVRTEPVKEDKSEPQPEPEEDEKDKLEEPAEEEEKSKKTRRKSKEPAPRLKIVKKEPVIPKASAKDKAQKTVKEEQETAKTAKEKSRYSKLKVVEKPEPPKKEDKKGVVKEDKIKRLKERFKPGEEALKSKGFPKTKRRRKREIIDIKSIDRPSRGYRKRKAPKKGGKKTEITTPKASKRVIKIGETVQVGELAKKMSVKAAELIAKLLGQGMMVTITQSIDADTAAIVAQDFDFTVERSSQGEDDIIKRISQESSGKLVERPPVVTVMGHVDHGKTSLLDHIRKTNVIDTEAGGITQSIGAYSVDVGKSRIVFVDTPGHEAFTAMRARGAQVTDIVVLIVAADDGVMPQTVEAINHARDAKVPIIVAINKIDKPGVNPERVRQGLTEHGLVPEDWGGEDIFVNISAKKGDGVPELLDMIALQAEMLDLKADAEKLMKGVVIESRLDKGKGPIATLIVKEGTLRTGQPVVVGDKFGRVRAMQDEKGKSIEEAGPSAPVEIQGLNGVPEAGEICYVLDDEKLAKQVSSMRQKKSREVVAEARPKVSLEDLYAQIQQHDLKEVKLIIKADTAGSAEALKGSLTKLSGDKVVVKCIHEGVGGISEGDIMLASASNAIIIGFNVRTESGALGIADKEDVSVKFYSVIYDAIDDVKKAIEGMLEPKIVEKTVGRAEVRQVFNISKLGAIAGSSVIDGKIIRTAKARLLRENSVVYTGDISSLKRFKDDVKEVLAGQECGIGIENYNDIKVGDLIECYEVQEIKQTL